MKIEWNAPGQRIFETGVSNGVLFPKAGPGVPWNGLVSVSEEETGGDVENLYFEGLKRLDIVANEDYSATIEAVSAPPEFNASDGVKSLAPGLMVGHQPRKTFDFSYRSLIGNDIQGENFGYKLHIIYNATAAPSPMSYKTLTNGASLDPRSWSISCVPPKATAYKPTAHIVIDSTKADPYLLQNVEAVLYGRDGFDARLPSQEEVLGIFSSRITALITEFI